MISFMPEGRCAAYSPEDLATMQLVYMGVCANCEVPVEDAARRQAVARAILAEFDEGIRDVDKLKSVAITVAKSNRTLAGGSPC